MLEGVLEIIYFDFILNILKSPFYPASGPQDDEELKQN